MKPIDDSMTKYDKMTATKYMSKRIREAVQCFGGTLVFDGADVFYEAVFSTREVRVGDTAEEARALFPVFAQFPGESSVKWGRGTLIFHWRGKETAPTQALFRESWQYIGDRKGGGGGPLTHQKESTLESYECGIIFGEYEKDGKKTWGLHQDEPRKELLNDLWSKFPPGTKRDTALSPETRKAREKHLEMMAQKSEPNVAGSFKAKMARKVDARKAAENEAAEKEAASPLPPPPPIPQN